VSRWVIDLASDEGVLLAPIDYHTIERIEDRLFVPVEYVPLFENKDWKRRNHQP
jgi:hypothetical protein